MFMLSIYKKELNSMNFIISGKNIEVTPGLKEAIEQKLGKLERYFTPETEIIVTLSVEKGRQKIEVTIPVKGSIIRSEQTSSDMYVSIDLVEEVIERQLRKYKNKLVAKSQGHPTAAVPSGSIKKEFIESDDESSDDDEIRIVRTKKFGIKPMFPEDACIQKPHKEIFDFALKNTNSRRSESLMIGDSWEADIIGAHNSKIDQLWLNPKGLPAKEFIPTYTVGSLEEIKRIL